MNNLCTDIGYRSLLKHHEQLCGDHIDIIDQEDGTKIIVLADGLGSGVKACILSTLTSKIISTMMAEGISIEECVATIAATLPVCSVRKVAYSTFTILKISPNSEAEVIEYDNPGIILIRDGENYELNKTELNIGGKKIYKSKVQLYENDVFVMMSDGCIYAGVGKTLNFGWKREDIIEMVKILPSAGYTAKTMTTILLDECNKLYGYEPGDDTTACVVRIRKREPMNLLFGPPSNPDDCNRMMSLFFSKGGKHIVCGGTTSSIAAKYLGKSITPSLNYSDPKIPPTAEIEGVDLVTEGVITINRVLEYAKDYLEDNQSYVNWCYKKDGASLISRLLFEEATDINFYVGRAMNPAHQNPNLPINFNIKMQLVQELSECLKKMGKNIKVSYF
ncbi:MAG: serine/threonine-protein phosphatase [Anaeroplasma bactoclasticum]|nr:serine/threonine-protein phosphatase [Staphylococcus sp.]MCM1350457.1 serine/threonine-protein phosphatase [Prevotella sp.]MCM1513703.1 serine/threonine-protein phosphatase [Anaeroplasma bactoclasticum]